VLIPEIWIVFSKLTGIAELARTTRDEPDYDKLMRGRLDLLARHKLGLPDIHKVIEGMQPLPGAREFLDAMRSRFQVVILDMMMPKMSGGDLLDSLQAMISDPSLNFQGDPPAIIIVTGAPQEDLPSETIEQRYGGLVHGVYRKPIDLDRLLRAVEVELNGT
jgi:CheY-like chemotaxis protein